MFLIVSLDPWEISRSLNDLTISNLYTGLSNTKNTDQFALTYWTLAIKTHEISKGWKSATFGICSNGFCKVHNMLASIMDN